MVNSTRSIMLDVSQTNSNVAVLIPSSLKFGTLPMRKIFGIGNTSQRAER